jgi:hypothetical protein
MEPDWLPPAGRPHHEPLTLRLENCQAVRIVLEVPAPRIEAIIVWRDRPRRVRPEPSKPIRELEAGDVVVIGGERRVVVSVEPWR